GDASGYGQSCGAARDGQADAGDAAAGEFAGQAADAAEQAADAGCDAVLVGGFGLVLDGPQVGDGASGAVDFDLDVDVFEPEFVGFGAEFVELCFGVAVGEADAELDFVGVEFVGFGCDVV